MHLRSMRAQSVTIPAALTRVDFSEGETIWTESSHKYRAADVLHMAKRTGYRCEGQWIDEEWPFAQNLLICE
jgi:L-histidine N-alpha-methyltransferase